MFERRKKIKTLKSPSYFFKNLKPLNFDKLFCKTILQKAFLFAFKTKKSN